LVGGLKALDPASVIRRHIEKPSQVQIRQIVILAKAGARTTKLVSVRVYKFNDCPDFCPGYTKRR